MTGPGESWHLWISDLCFRSIELLEGRTAFSAGATFYELYENIRLWGFFCVVGCGGLFL